jgi:hypothetical protein
MRIQNLHKNFVKSLYLLRQQQQVISTLETILGTPVQQVEVLTSEPGFPNDALIADGQIIYLSNLTETPYFDILWDIIQKPEFISFTAKELESKEIGLDASLTTLLGL